MTPGRWPRQKLGKLVDVKGGKRLPAGAAFSTVPTDHPYIRGQDIRNGRIRIGEPLFVTEEVFQKIRRYTVDAGDVCVTIVGNIGDVGITPADLAGANLTENAVKLIPLVRDLDRRYLAYALLSPNAQEQMKLSAAGAAQPKLGIYKVNEIEVPIPDPESQRRIASILSAYDDLIENNTRRIAILEEMARRIYEEWFVRFRFPGHENVRMVESALGLVPDGWTAATLGETAAYINRGLAPKYDETAAGLVINQKCIRDQRLNLVEARRQSKPVSPDKLVRRGDVLVNSTGVGTLGRVAQVQEEVANCTVDTHVSIVRPRPNMAHDFFGLTLLLLQPLFEAQGVGSTGQTELSRGRISDTGLVVPPSELQKQFGTVVGPMRELAVRLAVKNSNLRTTRDLLLPKLISGELDVSVLPDPEAIAA